MGVAVSESETSIPSTSSGAAPKPAAAEPAPTNEQLREWDRSAVWHAFTQMAEYEPLIFTEGRGAILTDDHGNELIDAVSSLWCNVHGHQHPALDQAIKDQLQRVAHVTMLGASTPATIKLAHRLAECAPGQMPHVFFSSDGAAGVEVALKLAFQYWQQRDDPRPNKTQFVALENAYHGDTLGSVSVGGVARFHEMFRPLLFDVHRALMPDAFRLPDGIDSEQAADYYLSSLRQILEQHHEHIAAMVMEPLIQCAAGMVKHPPGYLKGVRELTREFDVLLILDEVATGFGRTGKLFACQHENVEPDLLCLGKGLTGGYLPMAATMATDTVWNAFLGDYAESRHFFHGHTFSGNALAAAVSLASLELFRSGDLLRHATQLGERLQMRLEQLRGQAIVGDVRRVGLIGAIELSLDPALKIPFPWTERKGQQVCDYARTQGVFLRPLGSVVVVMPPLCISNEQLDTIMDAVEAGLEFAAG